MSDQMVRGGDRQLDREAEYEERLERKIKELLPVVAANPNTYDIDVNLLGNGKFLEFLEEAFKPGGNVAGALAKLAVAYNKLAEEEAENLAHDAIRAEDEQGDYDG